MITYFDVIARREAVRSLREVLQAALDNGIFTSADGQPPHFRVALSPKGAEASRAILIKEREALDTEANALNAILNGVCTDEDLLKYCHFPEKEDDEG